MAYLAQTVEVEGVNSTYTVTRERALILISSGRATQLSADTIVMVGRNRSKYQAREWAKVKSGPVAVMQLVETRKRRPRNKPKFLKDAPNPRNRWS